MIVALVFAAAFTGGLVERLVGRNLTGLLGRRAVPRSDHVIVAGLGQVGLRLCMLLREAGVAVVAIDDQPDGEHVGLARQLKLPVVIGRGGDPSLLRRLSLDRARALAAVTSEDLENVRIALVSSRRGAGAPDRPARGQPRDRRRDPLARAARPRPRRAPDRGRLPRRRRARLRRRARRRRRGRRPPARGGRRPRGLPLSGRRLLTRVDGRVALHQPDLRVVDRDERPVAARLARSSARCRRPAGAG